MFTMTSREFNQDTGEAKRAAAWGPVLITDRGVPAHVLLSYAEYTKLTGKINIVDALACPGTEEIDFDPPKLQSGIMKPVEFD